MGNKKDYRLLNKEFMLKICKEEDSHPLPNKIWYKILEKGEGTQHPAMNSLVMVYYKGSLVDGREFDSNFENGYPEAFRLKDLIEGWRIALMHMVVGDRWMIYIPADMGYGNKNSGPIPGNSTLVFEVKLEGIA